MEQKIIVTVIDGLGIVEAKNDLAHFTLSIKAKSETLDNAKSQVEEKVQQVLKALDKLKTQGMKLDADITTSLANYKLEHREGSERTPVGYQSINTINFTTIVDDNLDEIYKTCLKFDSTMNRPYFSLKNRTVLQEQAIQKATTDAKQKLNTECTLLNVSSDKLQIQDWKFGYEGYIPSATSQNTYLNGAYGVTGSSGATGPIGPGMNYSSNAIAMKIGTTYQELLDYKLEPGMVSVRVAVRINYIWA
jgi:hypothetical protein